jgi:hypothetical protein
MLKVGVFSRGPEHMKIGRVGRSNHKYVQCVAFWVEYLEDCAPRPNEETRIYPSSVSLDLQYRELFVGVYVAAQGWTGGEIPSFSTWSRARRDPLFSDVVDAKKHFHARCDTCHDVRRRLLLAFGQPEMQLVKLTFREHNVDIKDFRQLDAYWDQMAKHNPTQFLVLMFDDTECARNPHLGPNPPKSWGPRKKTLKVVCFDAFCLEFGCFLNTETRMLSHTLLP